MRHDRLEANCRYLRISSKSSFTKSKLEKKKVPESQINGFLENYNYMANLQLMEGIPNQEKSKTQFSDWVENTFPKAKERKDYFSKNYIPDVDLDLGNFDEFISERTKLMKDEFKKRLQN